MSLYLDIGSSDVDDGSCGTMNVEVGSCWMLFEAQGGTLCVITA